jgi:hypothetical protein
MTHRSAFAWLSLLVVTLTLGCSSRPAPVVEGPARAAESPATRPLPESLAQVDELRQRGVSWSNEEVRAHYNRLVSAIGPANARWKSEGLPAEERARRAWQLRHDARILTRAMMSDPREVELLRKRDLEKYGHPDGPTFELLVEKQRRKGSSGDAVYEAIIESAQRTNPNI